MSRLHLLNGEWLDSEEYAFRKAANSQDIRRSHLPVPMVSGSDTMDPLQSMADGKVYTSKAAMRASYKADNNPQGVTYTEVGNEYQKTEYKKPKPKPKGIKDSIEKAVATLRTQGKL